MARLVPTRLIRTVYVWIASLLFLLLVGAWQPVGGVLYESQGWLAIPHVAVQVTGVWLIARGVSAIDGLELAGIRTASTTAPLQARGVYGLVRHPIYLGTVLAVFGFPRMTGDRLLFAVFVLAYLAIGVLWEERSLERAFGAEYRSYKQRVRWRIVPYLY
jgi:protein-S-isoprenylcysteine O-methyltransferase Ste14